MRDLVFTLVLLAAIPVCLTSSHLAVAFWYWVSFFQPHTQSYSFATSVPFGPVAAALALLSWMFSQEKKLPPATPLVVLLVLMGAWVSFTTLIALYPDAAAKKWDITIKTLLMVLIGIAVVQTRQRLDILIWTICVAIGYYGFKLGLFALTGGLGENYRGPSYMNENNGLSRAMIMYLPLLIYLFTQYKQLWVRAGLAAVGGSSAVALIASGSRGAWVATLAMVAFAGLRVRGLLWLIPLGIASLAAIPFLPESIIARFASIGQMDTDASFQGRVQAWHFGLDLFSEHPIAGGGFGVFDYGFGRASHNSYFQALGEHGLVGLCLFVSILITWALALRWIRRAVKGRPDLQWADQLAYMLQFVLVGYCVGSLTINHAVFPVLYAVLGIVASLQIIVRHQLQADRETALNAVPPSPAFRRTRRPQFAKNMRAGRAD